VPTTKKSRVCRLVIRTSLGNRSAAGAPPREIEASTGPTPAAVSNADPREIENADPRYECDGHQHADEDHDAERACQSRGPRGTSNTSHGRILLWGVRFYDYRGVAYTRRRWRANWTANDDGRHARNSRQRGRWDVGSAALGKIPQSWGNLRVLAEPRSESR